jgi:hypothetical protein
MHYSTDPAKTSEAHMLNIQAILLEPDNLNYRLNAAAVFMRAQRYDDAIHVLQAAIHVAKTPEQVAAVQGRIDQIEQFQASVAHSHEANSEAAAQTAGVTVIDTRTMTIKSSDGRQFAIKPNTSSEGPKYPTEAPNGPHHTARGILRNVQCSYPSILTLKVDPADKAPAILLYRNDFRQIEFTVTNFTPKSDINPCTDIQGLKAKVEYAEVSDKSIAGQIISIELSK